MALTQELLILKTRILDEAKIAAHKGDVKVLVEWTRAAEQCEKDIQEAAAIETRVRHTRDSLPPKDAKTNIESTGDQSIAEAIQPKPLISPKQDGANVREAWVKKLDLMGIRLAGHGKRFTTEDGRSVGVTFANELKPPKVPDSWWLGLKDEPTDVVVLLCRDLAREMYDIIIPVADLGPAWNLLSRNKRQVVIFKVRRDADDLLLDIPGGGQRKALNRYLGNYEPLIGPPVH